MRTSNLKDIQKIEKLDGKNRPYIVVYFLDTLLIYLLVPASHLFWPQANQSAKNGIQKTRAWRAPKFQRTHTWHTEWRALELPIIMATSEKVNSRWFNVTFSSPSWRSLNHLKGSLNHPKKVTKNCQVCRYSKSDRYHSNLQPFQPLPIMRIRVTKVISTSWVVGANHPHQQLPAFATDHLGSGKMMKNDHTINQWLLFVILVKVQCKDPSKVK